jgi:hypothetical protein
LASDTGTQLPGDCNGTKRAAMTMLAFAAIDTFNAKLRGIAMLITLCCYCASELMGMAAPGLKELTLVMAGFYFGQRQAEKQATSGGGT